jgi:hypothetical protein
VFRRVLPFLPALIGSAAALPEPDFREVDRPPHNYHAREPRDRFTRLKADLEAGRIPLDRSSERAFVISLLRALEIPVTSQMLVFSTTSLQLRLITPANPRALYFNEEVYLGWVPGGRIEVLSLDPELGAIFYIFDPPREGAQVRVERSERCMNCHAGDDTGRVPGLVVKSVLPGVRGGSLTAFRIEQTGHGIPFDQRFGGWFVTGEPVIAASLGNMLGQFSGGQVVKTPIVPGMTFNFDRYPVATSNVLPQLLHEHQAGFVNRVVEAGYRARTYLHADEGKLTPDHAALLDEQARLVTRYLLFADEAPLRPDDLVSDPAFQADFVRTRLAAPGGAALKDFDLQTRLFRNRCSYMIYSPIFAALPGPLKERIFAQLQSALNPTNTDAAYAYLPASEKQQIRTILKATLPGVPAGW